MSETSAVNPDRGHRNVGFADAAKLFFANYVNFQGRSSRGAYWWATLAQFLAFIAFSLIDMALFGEDTAILSSVFALAVIIPGISLSVRRLHDSDMSGWWYLITLIPLIGTIIALIFYIRPGTHGENRFGPDVEAGRSEAASTAEVFN